LFHINWLLSSYCILPSLWFVTGQNTVWYDQVYDLSLVCLYNYEFWLSLCKIARSSVILLLPLYTVFWPVTNHKLGRVQYEILMCQNSRFHYGSKFPAVTITVFITILEQNTLSLYIFTIWKSIDVIFIWETGYWTRAIKRFVVFDLLKNLYFDTKIVRL
jgi:hypothetical protein